MSTDLNAAWGELVDAYGEWRASRESDASDADRGITDRTHTHHIATKVEAAREKLSKLGVDAQQYMSEFLP